MGFKQGEAMRLYAKLFPRSGNVASVERVLSSSPVSNGRSNECAPEFPALSGGLPSARDLKAWMPSVVDVLERRGIDVRELTDMQRDPRSELDPGWDHGGVTDRELWSVLLRCGKRGLPAEIMMSLPASVREGRQGLRAFQHLFRRVLLVSDESLGALQAWFDAPPVVRRRGDLLPALNNWKNVVEELERAGCLPWPPAQRQSLVKMTAALEDAKAIVFALKAANKLEVVDLCGGLERLGVEFSSQQQQYKALGVFVDSEQSRKGQQQKQQPTGRCKFFDAGRCTWGDRCRFKHVEGAGSVTTAADKRVVAVAAPTDQLKCLMADLQRKLASATADETKWCAPSKSWSSTSVLNMPLMCPYAVVSMEPPPDSLRTKGTRQEAPCSPAEILSGADC